MQCTRTPTPIHYSYINTYTVHVQKIRFMFGKNNDNEYSWNEHESYP